MSNANLNGVVEVPGGPQKPTATRSAQGDPLSSYTTSEEIIDFIMRNGMNLAGKKFTISGELVALLAFFPSQYVEPRTSLSYEERSKLLRTVADKFNMETGLR